MYSSQKKTDAHIEIMLCTPKSCILAQSHAYLTVRHANLTVESGCSHCKQCQEVERSVMVVLECKISLMSLSQVNSEEKRPLKEPGSLPFSVLAYIFFSISLMASITALRFMLTPLSGSLTSRLFTPLLLPPSLCKCSRGSLLSAEKLRSRRQNKREGLAWIKLMQGLDFTNVLQVVFPRITKYSDVIDIC